MEYELMQYSFGCMSHTIAWLKGETHYTPEAIAHYQYKCMPDIIKKAFEKPY